MQDEGASQAILLGAIMGARMAMVLALQHPNAFKALVLVGGSSVPASPDHFNAQIHGYRDQGVSALHRGHLDRLVSAAFATSRLGGYLLSCQTGLDSELSRHAIARVFEALSSNKVADRLGSIEQPTLVVNGEYDIALSRGRESAQRIPNGHHAVLAGAGHACFLEDPAGFDALVLDFLGNHGLMPKGRRR